jgi:glycosyltransferase involved in cell wall biosynthesis
VVTFSIVTVTHNAAAVLPGTLESLRAQRDAEYEWVLADGGSTDATMQIARSFDAAPASLVSEPDRGIYDAMNKAVARAQGDWVYFLNADDALAAPDVLARVAARAGDADLVVGRVLVVGDGPDVLRGYDHLTPRRLLFDSLCHQAVFARRNLFERFGVFDLQYRYAADYDWLLRVWRGGARVVFEDSVVARFRAGGAHAKAAKRTAEEYGLIRHHHAPAWALTLGGLWFHNLYRVRRLVGREAVGRTTLA